MQRSGSGYGEHVTPDEWSEKLRSHGLQVTAQRLAVLRSVDEHPHRPARAIEHDAREALGAISRQAVFDVLGALTAHDVLRRVESAGSPARYEIQTGDNHHHLSCRTCGDLVDVGCVGTAPCAHTADMEGFAVEHVEVTFWGRCRRCRQSLPPLKQRNGQPVRERTPHHE
jgi:Fur family ferric uptake transcriptional regulator